MTDTSDLTPDGQAAFTAALLQLAMQNRGVKGGCAVGWRGPQYNTYIVSLDVGESPERIEALAGALAIAAGAKYCRVTRDAGKLMLEIPKPENERRVLSAKRLDEIQSPNPLAVAAGVTTGGRVVWLDLNDERFAHVVIGGATGSGKTEFLRWILYRLAMQNDPAHLRLILLDPKVHELGQFERLPHLLHPVTANPTEIGQVMAWVETELNERLASGRSRPRIAVVIEEVADVVATNRAAPALLNRIAQIGRTCGISLIVTTQQPGARALDSAVANFPARIIGYVASQTLTFGATGRARTSAHSLLGKGDFLLLYAGDDVHFQAPLPNAREFAKLPRADHVASLSANLPSPVMFGDLQVDPRGGRGRRPLDDNDYQEIERAIRAGARADDLKRQFGIGYERGKRLVDQYAGGAA